MTSEHLRQALQDYIKTNDINVSDWCRRAGISKGTVYSFLSGYSENISATRLIALADAEGVLIDDLVGRKLFDVEDVRQTIICLAENLGGNLTIEEVSRVSGVSVRALQTAWPSVDSMIIDAYISINLERAKANIDMAAGRRVRDRLSLAAKASFQWYDERRGFYDRYQSLIKLGSFRDKERDTEMEDAVASQIATEILDKSSDLLIVDKGESFRIAKVLLALFHMVIKNYGAKSPDYMTDTYMSYASSVLTGRVATKY